MLRNMLSLHLALKFLGLLTSCFYSMLAWPKTFLFSPASYGSLFNTLLSPCRLCFTHILKPTESQHYHEDSCLEVTEAPHVSSITPSVVSWISGWPRHFWDLSTEGLEDLAPWVTLSTAPIYSCNKSCPLWERLRTHCMPKSVFSPQRYAG